MFHVFTVSADGEQFASARPTGFLGLHFREGLFPTVEHGHSHINSLKYIRGYGEATETQGDALDRTYLPALEPLVKTI